MLHPFRAQTRDLTAYILFHIFIELPLDVADPCPHAVPVQLLYPGLGGAVLRGH
jgi:hypothetical protein